MKKLLAIMLSLCIILGLCTVAVFAYDYAYEVGEVCGAEGNKTFSNDQFEEALAEARATGGTIFLWEDFNQNNNRTNVIDVDIKAVGENAQIVCGVDSVFEFSGVIDAPLSSWGGTSWYIRINGTGTFKQEVRSYSNSLFINGGTFEGPVYAAGDCAAYISGGTFLDRVYAETGENKTASLTIYGGSFYDFDALRYMHEKAVAIKLTDEDGNVFYTVYQSLQRASETLPEGMKLERTDDAYAIYTIRELTDDDYVAELVSADGAVKGRYIGINAANNAAYAGDTIRLIKDYTMTEGVRINKKLTLDLNGFSIISESGFDQINVDDGGILTIIDSTESETAAVTAVIICTPENRDGTVQQIDFNGGSYVIKNGGYFGAEGILNFNAGSFDGNIYLRGRGYGTYSFNGGVYTNFTLKVPGPGFKVWIDSDPYDHAKFYGGVYTPLESDYDAAYEFVSGHLGEGKRIVEVVPGKTFMVGEAEAEVNVEPAELTLYINEETKTCELKAEVTPKGLPVIWESSDTEVASVDENGTVTAVAVGKATVTARVTLYVDGEATVFEDTCEVTVAEKMSPPPAPDRDDGTDIKDDDTPLDEEPLPFEDVNEDDWFYEYVEEVYDEELMRGVSGDKFAPFSSTTRGLIATVIHRLEKCPEPSSEMRFADVAETWYYDAIRWGTEKEILKGYSSEKFGPKDNVTREQLIAILYRYATMKGVDTGARSELDAFEDAGRVSGYAVEAMQWAVAEGIIEGSGGRLKPRDEANRAEVAAIMSRFMSYSK